MTHTKEELMSIAQEINDTLAAKGLRLVATLNYTESGIVPAIGFAAIDAGEDEQSSLDEVLAEPDATADPITGAE